MNKNDFSDITMKYSFLDDYENELRMNRKNKTNPQIKKDQTTESSENQKFMNNYPEFDKPVNDQEDEEENNKKFYDTRYGHFINKSLDPSRLNDIDYVYENLDIDRNVQSNAEFIEKSDKQMLKDVEDTIKKREIRFYAFLNKEFNIINKKMINCSILCYSNPKMFTVNEAKLCAESCHRNIKEAGQFAERLQEEKKEKLVNCLDRAKDYDINKSEDKIASFFKCYEDLMTDFDVMEKDIKSEFSNFI